MLRTTAPRGSFQDQPRGALARNLAYESGHFDVEDTTLIDVADGEVVVQDSPSSSKLRALKHNAEPLQSPAGHPVTSFKRPSSSGVQQIQERFRFATPKQDTFHRHRLHRPSVSCIPPSQQPAQSEAHSGKRENSSQSGDEKPRYAISKTAFLLQPC